MPLAVYVARKMIIRSQLTITLYFDKRSSRHVCNFRTTTTAKEQERSGKIRCYVFILPPTQKDHAAL